ncbi:MAG: hypothetical protein ABI224_05950 [Acetobacteraceae bacterium]
MKAPRATAEVGGKRRIQGWMWVVGLAVLAIVVWQVAQGVFVKSVSVPGGGDISFFPPRDASNPNSANTIEQDGGSGNKAAIHGDHNSVHQSGTGNSAVIGGLRD